jgi:ADP-ribose pyrophosphatase
MVKKWKKISGKQIADYFIFKVNKNVSQSPVTGKEHTFYALDARDWTNIIAITPENRVVMVRQYRHGIEDVTLEIPAGHVETDDPSSEASIKRELLEETGYEVEEVVYIGAVHPNPAFLNNMCQTFLAKNAKKVGEQNLEETEDILIQEVDLESIPRLILSGEISHSLTIAAFYLFEQYQKLNYSV